MDSSGGPDSAPPPPVAASAQTWTANAERTNRKEQIEETKKEKEEFNEK